MRYPFRGLTLALCAVALVAGTADVSAQAWPTKPIRIINP
jgi:tripartite-type tricarboxylate transporter receptor subunit TctC